MGNNAHKSGEQHRITTQIDKSKWQTRSWATDIEIERVREREGKWMRWRNAYAYFVCPEQCINNYIGCASVF